MADYKSIITGALSNVVGKVKEVANRESVRELYEQGASRAKSYGRIAKLTLEVNSEGENLKRVYTEIGKLYFEQAKDAPEGYFAPLFAQAEEISASIAAKGAEIDALKAAMEEEECDVEVEFEEVVEAAEEDACCCEEAPVEEAPCCCEETPVEETPCCCEETPVEEAPCCCEETPVEEAPVEEKVEE